MKSVIGKAIERSAMQRFSHSGMALLPWTRQILTVLWENVRLMLQVICCSLMAVFQMFRFELHLRITDDTGEHIQHMTNAHGDTEGFLLSSLFESNKNVVVAGPNPLSRFNKDPFNLNSHSRSVLSSLVNDDLCCSLVDNLVSCATECLNENEDVCVGEQFGWKHRFDWNFHTGLEGRVDEECLPTLYGNEVQKQSDCCTGVECNWSRLSFKSQSSDSEFSWGSSDSSSIDREREDSDGLWDLLRCSNDPYHPLHFTACMSSAVANRQRTQPGSSLQRNEFTSTPSSVFCFSDSSEQGNTETVNSEDEEEALWKSLSWDDDPYHPLNFRAPLSSAHAFTDSHEKGPKTSRDSTSTRCPKPILMQRQVFSHRCPQMCVEKPAKVPWKRPINKTVDASMTKKISTVKRVKFSPVVQIHKMRAWSFALQACRKGPWEEHARDRDRFQRRILETEQAIGYCFMRSHRDKFFIYHQSTLTK
ncbi:protein phosphatase 1 regulatory subunit 15B isoform X2 [Ictalurus punctatus]|uniref:Protein phosphatase 1 regulatory subunit 15B isoform X2 n=1 Tax=Ictalurus punctatus TaxID=7998 RepID=A0A2D0QSY1_ICTPU|nr:protein phosphatase 1 regulatory subunit 15B isoform X2 [Ictalurus punctatus]